VDDLEWIESLDVPAWASSHDQRLLALNRPARDLFGIEEIRQPCFCHDVVRGGRAGARLCGPECPVTRDLRAGRIHHPFDLEIPLGGDRVYRVLVAGVRRGREPCILHLATDVSQEIRLRAFFERVARRAGARAGSASVRRLSPREREVLALLSEDHTLREVADALHVSYATVRNHVQHILAHLGVHSVLEAIVAFLTSPPGRDEGAGSFRGDDPSRSQRRR